jgi:hypothetical protein
MLRKSAFADRLLRLLLAAVFGLLLMSAHGPAAAPAPAYASANVLPGLDSPVPILLPLLMRNWPLAALDLSVARVEVIQGITMGDAYTVHVAGRPALLRAFLNLSGVTQQAGVTGRLTRYVGGAAQDTLLAGPVTIAATTDEGSLAQTLNFNLPPHWLAPGTAYVLEVDPSNAIFETNEANNRFPGGGDQSFDFATAPVLEVVVVPVQYARPGAATSTPNTADLSYLTWMPIKVYPVAQINYSVRPVAHTFTGDLRTSGAWSELLYQVTAIHGQEDPAQLKLYYGLVDTVAVDGCSGGCIAGIGWVNRPNANVIKTAVGFAGFPSNRSEASPTFTHEMGHNFGRQHAPCGGPSGVGPFPYGSGASIGQWGLDPAAGQLLSPATYRDYMSYCGPEWTSDFTYRGIFDAWAWVSEPYGSAADLWLEEALVVSGYVDEGGQVHLDPAYVAAVPAVQLSQNGPYSLKLLDMAGQVLASQSFATTAFYIDPPAGSIHDHAADSVHHGFQVALPLRPGAVGLRLFAGTELLAERQSSGPAPRLGPPRELAAAADGSRAWTLGSGASGITYRVRFSPDGGQTWWLLAPASASPLVSIPPEFLASAPDPLIEVQASDGVRVTRRVYSP